MVLRASERPFHGENTCSSPVGRASGAAFAEARRLTNDLIGQGRVSQIPFSPRALTRKGSSDIEAPEAHEAARPVTTHVGRADGLPSLPDAVMGRTVRSVGLGPRFGGPERLSKDGRPISRSTLEQSFHAQSNTL